MRDRQERLPTGLGASYDDGIEALVSDVRDQLAILAGNIGPAWVERLLEEVPDPTQQLSRLLRLTEIFRRQIEESISASKDEKVYARSREVAVLGTLRNHVADLLRHGDGLFDFGEFVQIILSQPLNLGLADGVLLDSMKPHERDIYKLPGDEVFARLTQFVASGSGDDA